MKRPTFKKLILDDIKAAGHVLIAKKIRSITYDSFANGDAVRVRALCLRKKERELLDELLEDYRDGKFDSYEDIYVPKGREQRTKLRTAKYVFLNNEWPDNIKEAAWSDLKKHYGNEIDDIGECLRITGRWKDQLIYEFLNNL